LAAGIDNGPRVGESRSANRRRGAAPHKNPADTNKKGGPQGPPFLIQAWADQPPDRWPQARRVRLAAKPTERRSAIKNSRAGRTKKKGGPNGPPFPFRF